MSKWTLSSVEAGEYHGDHPAWHESLSGKRAAPWRSRCRRWGQAPVTGLYRTRQPVALTLPPGGGSTAVRVVLTDPAFFTPLDGVIVGFDGGVGEPTDPAAGL